MFGKLVPSRIFAVLMTMDSNRRCREIPLEEFDRMVQINLRAPFLLVKGVVEGMKAQHWGRIIFISSIAAYGAGINGARKYLSPHHHSKCLHVQTTQLRRAAR